VLEEFLEEMVPRRHARSTFLGEQIPIPLDHQGSTERATFDYTIARLGQVHLGAPRSRADGVPLHLGIRPSVNSPP
jgi:mannitol/fructose-specific phosphotransferase system IIA component